MKRKINVRLCARVAALVIAAIMLCIFTVSCGGSAALLRYGDNEISLSFYELMLSRMKGELARKKLDVESDSEFWSYTDASGKTREQYYGELVLDRCKNYLAALELFEKEGLTLTDAELAAIDEEIAFYVDYDGQGSRDKLDAMLSKYGTDTDGLREIYVIEAKYKKLMATLYGSDYSLISDGVKKEFYEKNYHRFKQIFVSNFFYEYQKDEQGNVIYFDPETGKPVYDTKNGKVIYVDGYSIKDQYGQPIYYDETATIIYDHSKGYPTPELDGNGEAIKYYYTEEEMRIRVAEMQEMLAGLKNGNYSAFEAEMPRWELYEGADEYYPDGYYLSSVESHGYEQYMLDILSALENMGKGEIRTVESDQGYHVIMKYELDEGKFRDAAYAEWFASFNEAVMSMLFLDKCKSFYGDIVIDTESLGKARSIRYIGVNYNF